MTRKPVLLAMTALLASLLVGVFGGVAQSSIAKGTTAAAPSAAVPNLTGKSFSVVSTEPGTNTVVLFKAVDYLRQWGANVEVKHVSAPANVIAAVGAGQVDIGDAPPLVGLQAQQAGLDIKAFAMSQDRTDDVFVGKRSITSLAGLRGANIGVLTTRGLNGIQVAQVLSLARLTASDVNVIFVGGQTVRVAALIAGRVDAGPISFDNYRAALQPAGFNSLYNYASQMPNLLRSFLWAKPSWIAANQDVALAVNEALVRSFRWVSNTKNRAAFIQYATSKLNGVNAADVGATYDDWIKYKIFHPNAGITEPAVRLNQDLFLQHNLIERRPAAVSDWVDVGFSQRALDKLGRIRTRGANPISVTVANGGRMRVTGTTGIFNGPAKITVSDASGTENVRLRGPGINRATGVAFRGKVVWNVTLPAGTYTLRSDRNGARGTRFIVTATG
jgi:ABC-type nitrate/sulfonate/bicarbonate transport system substrate-binding protein